ncbi:restriction endonuclease subunit S [Enterobacter cancerogenus]
MVPMLRFNETKNTTYSTVTLGDAIQSISSGRSKDCVENGNYKFYGSTGIIGFRSTADYEGTAILIARVGANAGSLYMVDGKYNVSDNTLIVSADTQFINYLYFYLSAINLNKLIYGSGQPLITGGMLKNLKIKIPGTKEQTKIADFLSSADEKITLLNKQYDLLCQYKKGMMQKIFSQALRFKDESGEDFPEWNSCQLKDVATRVTRKNKENNQTILTISGRDGLVDQMTYFNKQIASKNVAGYYLLSNGEFAYNKSYSQGYPMGAIKMLTNYDKGVVSTLYICFKLNTNQSNSFYQHYFESGLQNRSIEKVAQEGARNHGLLNIGVNDFFDIELQIPSLKEQMKIADYLSALDDKITVKKAELDKLKTWKQGLLQQMFV